VRQQTLDIDDVVEHAALAGIDQDKRTVECGIGSGKLSGHLAVDATGAVFEERTAQGIGGCNGKKFNPAKAFGDGAEKRVAFAANGDALRAVLDIGAAKNRA